MRSPRVAKIATAGVAILAVIAPAGQAAAATPDRVHVSNAQPSLTGARQLGSADQAQTITVKLYLRQRNSAELAAKVQSVSDPSSSEYGKYLTPEAFRARYSPDAATVDAVKAYLAGYGISVSSVPDNRAYVAGSGTVAQFQQAFGTSLGDFSMAGKTVRAAATAPTLPSALASQVMAVSGLASISALAKPNHEGPEGSHWSSTPGAGPSVSAPAAGTSAPPPPAFVNAQPCSSYYGEKVATSLPSAYGSQQPYAPCGYTPAQLQGAYGVASAISHGLDGEGVTVAITDAYAAPTILSDANTYAKRHGQEPFRKSQFKQVLPASFRYGYDDTTYGDLCGEQGWYGEETLDVEAVHALAPGANVTYVASPSCDNSDFADTLNLVVDKHLADIVTNSWGGINESNGSPELDQVYEQVFVQAALEGIGFYFSSGDSGDASGIAENKGVPTVQAPANSPYVTAVGGTSLAVGRNNQRLWETGWSTGKSALVNGAWSPAPPGSYQYGAGGGTSRVFIEPWYQKGVVPASLATRWSSTPSRVVPDVSTVGDPNTGMLIGETQTFPNGKARYSEFRIGGTSLASPVMAGIMALADQAAGHHHGFANPALYKAYGSDALYDPKAHPGGVVRVDYANGVDASGGLLYSLRNIDVTVGTILRAGPGYDDITGVGTPNGSAFLSALRH
ncbi:MAG TPA: S53 family peptidase [Kineosporiaceae bacterium]|nr:S53 family peptidase [Kineosporiaceae bacterium]